MSLGWTSKEGLLWFAYSPNMTSGQHTHKPFNGLICKHHDVICVECRMDPFKAKMELIRLFKVSAETYFLAISCLHITNLRFLWTQFTALLYPWSQLPTVIPLQSLSPLSHCFGHTCFAGFACLSSSPIQHIMHFTLCILCDPQSLSQTLLHFA